MKDSDVLKTYYDKPMGRKRKKSDTRLGKKKRQKEMHLEGKGLKA